jgi:phage tail sheath protein FI
MDGADATASVWKYIPVRRTALFIEESVEKGLQWTVFEPNAAPLWAQVTLDVSSFLHGLFKAGAFKGSTPKDAYFVRCDLGTMTQIDIENGRINVMIGFAPLKPAEFVILRISINQVS